MDPLAQKLSLARGARERQATEAALASRLPVPLAFAEGSEGAGGAEGKGSGLVDPWTAGETGLALLGAVLSGDPGAVRKALAEGCSPSLQAAGESILHFAVAADARLPEGGMTEELLAAGADPEARDPFGRTPLHGAALLDGRRQALALVRAGAGLAPDDFGETPLGIAVRLGRDAIAELLGPLAPASAARAA